MKIITKQQAEELARKLEITCTEARYAARLLRKNWERIAERPDMVLRISRMVEAIQ